MLIESSKTAPLTSESGPPLSMSSTLSLVPDLDIACPASRLSAFFAFRPWSPAAPYLLPIRLGFPRPHSQHDEPTKTKQKKHRLFFRLDGCAVTFYTICHSTFRFSRPLFSFSINFPSRATITGFATESVFLFPVKSRTPSVRVSGFLFCSVCCVLLCLPFVHPSPFPHFPLYFLASLYDYDTPFHMCPHSLYLKATSLFAKQNLSTMTQQQRSGHCRVNEKSRLMRKFVLDWRDSTRKLGMMRNRRFRFTWSEDPRRKGRGENERTERAQSVRERSGTQSRVYSRGTEEEMEE